MLGKAQEDVLQGHRYRFKLQEPPALFDDEPSEVLPDVPAELAFNDKHMGNSPGENMEDSGQGL